MTEDQLEQECLGWLGELGYVHRYGPEIAHELTTSLRANVTVDWTSRESVRAKLRILVRRILRKYKYPPDRQEEAAQLVLNQAETLCEAWPPLATAATSTAVSRQA